MAAKISDFVPELGVELSNYKGSELIDRIGDSVVKEVVISILCGENVRSLTENLTRRRLMLSNASMLVTFLGASSKIQNMVDESAKMIAEELGTKRLSKEKKLYLTWLAGLTEKSIQNVLRGHEQEELDKYLEELSRSLKESAEKAKLAFGNLSGTLKLGKNENAISWENIMFLFTAIGAQTLAIRGSEKSMYGKLFEKFILGSVLTILGFQRIDPKKSNKSDKIFWMSQRENKRESDATLLLKAGVGVRFDIGFIGPGNSEISLDKVSRFEREMDFGRQTHYMTTIIIVDRIGQNSRIKELASVINGEIVQMNMSYWVKEIAQILKEKIGFNHPILKMSNDESLKYIREQIKHVNLQTFL
jgi:CfrBI restriction endonuclease